MTRREFEQSLGADTLPPGLSLAQAALWHAQRGNWESAHTCAQEHLGKEGARVHAYLHRGEGDHANAGYWYRRAGQPVCQASLDDEWHQLVADLFSS